MPEILINKLTGAMAEIPIDGNLGTKGNELLLNPNICTKIVSGEIAEHIKRGHCVYTGGEIVLIPENEWSENRVIEDTDPEDI